RDLVDDGGNQRALAGRDAPHRAHGSCEVRAPKSARRQSAPPPRDLSPGATAAGLTAICRDHSPPKLCGPGGLTRPSGLGLLGLDGPDYKVDWLALRIVCWVPARRWARFCHCVWPQASALEGPEVRRQHPVMSADLAPQRRPHLVRRPVPFVVVAAFG